MSVPVTASPAPRAPAAEDPRPELEGLKLVSGQETTPLLPLALFFAAVLGLVAVMLGLSHVLGEPFAGGIVSTGSAWLRLLAKFHLLALFFIIFDLEAAFLVARAGAVASCS